MKTKIVITFLLTLALVSCLMVSTGCSGSGSPGGRDTISTNGFERAVRGINNAGKASSEAVNKFDTSLEKMREKAIRFAEHIEKYAPDSAQVQK